MNVKQRYMNVKHCNSRNFINIKITPNYENRHKSKLMIPQVSTIIINARLTADCTLIGAPGYNEVSKRVTRGSFLEENLATQHEYVSLSDAGIVNYHFEIYSILNCLPLLHS